LIEIIYENKDRKKGRILYVFNIIKVKTAEMVFNGVLRKIKGPFLKGPFC